MLFIVWSMKHIAYLSHTAKNQIKAFWLGIRRIIIVVISLSWYVNVVTFLSSVCTPESWVICWRRSCNVSLIRPLNSVIAAMLVAKWSISSSIFLKSFFICVTTGTNRHQSTPNVRHSAMDWSDWIADMRITVQAGSAEPICNYFCSIHYLDIKYSPVIGVWSSITQWSPSI